MTTRQAESIRSPSDPLRLLPGIGETRARELAEAGVETVLDLLLHLPFRYEDRTRLLPIRDVTGDGRPVTVHGQVLSANLVRTRRPGFTIFEALIDDGSGTLRLVFFNQAYLGNWVRPGIEIFAYGEPVLGGSRRRGLVMENPQIEADTKDSDDLSAGRVVPIYRKLPGLPPRTRRKLVSHVLDSLEGKLPERLPEWVRAKFHLPPLLDSLREAHFPGSRGADPDPVPWEERRSPHLTRLILEEFLEFQISLAQRRQARESIRGPVLVASDETRSLLKSVLPFPLTGAQKRVIREIGQDFRSGRPMRRLLQGDVGSGKTIVSVLSAVLAARCGYQSALMAPTEILAEQHAGNIFRLLSGSQIRPALLTGRIKGRARSALLGALAAGEIDFLIGTHALLERPVEWKSLGLAVIDEQHRFGVAQRSVLTSRVLESGEHPHLLVLSATPIPRSLALTLYGDLDVSVLDEKPPGRSPIQTRVVPESERGRILEEIVEEVALGGQAYVVVPLIEESDHIEARAVEKHAEELRQAMKGLRIGVVHGRLSAEERESTMAAFARGQLDVLAATTVIEVGVDVPNASFLVVENAERFGLAQLHQLRGRVGRGDRPSKCVFLFGPNATGEARGRLAVLARTEDGFKVAEEDLQRRGPGDMLGTRQSGIPLFRVGDIVRDGKWIRAASETAREIVSRGEDGPLAVPCFIRAIAPAAE
ncbi:MAG: ATP-dependent DNA helicase RecG [Acidobacteria bacterium]|nr:ATP-dependent DNA helicase RecG [Acidobacteriota bacterium]MCG3194331.1 ATP-dependent DNA helicase RecG [Thermoanaerobaculia bacterium]